MSAETMHRAAALIRERAKGATPGAADVASNTWHFLDNGSAFAVADWLDGEARASVDVGATLTYALAVARAYLGEAS